MNAHIVEYDRCPLHPKLTYTFPDSLDDFPNLIFYGPAGVGKHTQMLAAIRKYSPSGLKYEKRIVVETSKDDYELKISDIHFEVDMSLLGCNAKQLWNDIYTHIVDVLLSRPSKSGIVVCKYFHDTPQDLLQCFYSYMQTLPTESFKLKYVFITETFSFIPDSIAQRCYKVRVPRPSKAAYQKCTGKTITQDLHDVISVKNPNQPPFHRRKSLSIFSLIVDEESHKFTTIRDCVYDLLTYNLNVYDSMWFIIENLISNGYIQTDDIADTMLYTYRTLKYYNNNYRPIYHLERWVVYLINKVHGYEEGVSDIEYT